MSNDNRGRAGNGHPSERRPRPKRQNPKARRCRRGCCMLTGMANATLALTEVLGAPVVDSTGAYAGRVREVGLCPEDDAARVAAVIVRTKQGDRVLPWRYIAGANGGIRSTTPQSSWAAYAGAEGYLLLGRDLLDQQIIDINGRKV